MMDRITCRDIDPNGSRSGGVAVLRQSRSALRRSELGHGHGQAIGARMHGSAPWKTEETIVGLPRLLVLSGSSDLILQIWWLSPFSSSNARFGPVEDRRNIVGLPRLLVSLRSPDLVAVTFQLLVEDQRNNRRLATFTCTLCVLQIWWLSPFSSLRSPDLVAVTFQLLVAVTFQLHSTLLGRGVSGDTPKHAKPRKFAGRKPPDRWKLFGSHGQRPWI